jgi:GrpB-like predicted nucleotidyltransferase (UPF0157 family)
MKGESIARVRRQQRVAAKHQIEELKVRVAEQNAQWQKEFMDEMKRIDDEVSRSYYA